MVNGSLTNAYRSGVCSCGCRVEPHMAPGGTVGGHSQLLPDAPDPLRWASRRESSSCQAARTSAENPRGVITFRMPWVPVENLGRPCSASSNALKREQLRFGRQVPCDQRTSHIDTGGKIGSRVPLLPNGRPVVRKRPKGCVEIIPWQHFALPVRGPDRPSSSSSQSPMKGSCLAAHPRCAPLATTVELRPAATYGYGGGSSGRASSAAPARVTRARRRP